MAKAPATGLKAALFMAAAFACGVGGVLLGLELRGDPRAGGDPAARAFAADRESRLRVGDPFPHVDLVDEQGGTVGTSELLGGSGAVVLFLDPECPPCQDMSLRWQQQIDDGLIAADRVVGITTRIPERNADYARQAGLTFQVFCDPGAEYRDEHRVRVIPFEVVVGASGLIRAASHEYEAPVESRHISNLLTR